MKIKSIIKSIISFTVITTMLMVNCTSIFAADLDVAGSLATIYNANGLYSALTNKNISEIRFANDIQVNRFDIDVLNNRTDTSITIDGQGHTLYEYTVTAISTAKPIRLTKTGNIKQITLKNMDIVGQNGYGTVYIPSTVKDVSLVYDNVNYNGPQLAYNTSGTVILKNSNVTLDYNSNCKFFGELSESTNLVFDGNNNISMKDNAKNSSTAWVELASKGSISVNPNAVVNIKSENTTRPFEKGNCTFTIGSGATFNYSGFKNFQVSGSTFSTWLIDKNANVDISITNTDTSDIFDATDFTVGENANANFTVNNLNCTKVFDLTSFNINQNAEVNISLNNGKASSHLVSVGKNFLADQYSHLNLTINQISTSYGALYAGGTFTVSPYAAVNIDSNVKGTARSRGLWVAGDININPNASFVIHTVGDREEPAVKAFGNVNILDNAIFKAISTDTTLTDDDPVVRMYTTGKTLTIQNPSDLLIYNSTDKDKNTRALSFEAQCNLNITARSIDYWNSAAATGGYDVLTNPASSWSSQTPFNVNAKALLGKISSITTTYAGSEALNKTTFDFGQTRVIEIQGDKTSHDRTVVYDPNGGTGSYVDKTMDTLSYFVKTANQAGFERQHYEFVSWNTMPDGSGVSYKPGDKTIVKENMTLYAQWNAVDYRYTIKYYSVEEDGSSDEIGSVSDWIVVGQTLNLSDDQLNAYRPEDLFKGRYVYGSGVLQGAPVTITTDEQIVKVYYRNETRTVVLNYLDMANNNELTFSMEIYYVGDVVDMNLYKKTITNYNFNHADKNSLTVSENGDNSITYYYTHK